MARLRLGCCCVDAFVFDCEDFDDDMYGDGGWDGLCTVCCSVEGAVCLQVLSLIPFDCVTFLRLMSFSRRWTRLSCSLRSTAHIDGFLVNTSTLFSSSY